MSRLTWGASGQRFYETGVDRGVLYVGSQPGVAWDGLTSVSESPNGGSPKPYYLDGVKYLNVSSSEEFEATINAFANPPEFAPCDGTSSLQNGLFVTQQVRKSFGFSYRTTFGNDVAGSDYGYKIHLVYNALAAPSNRDNKTFSDSSGPTSFGWKITTQPPTATGYKPTAHLVIDSTTTAPFRLKSVEDILYGSAVASPRLPLPDEMVWLFSELAYLPLKLVLVDTNTYEVHEVDPADARTVMQATSPLTPAPGEDPIFWIDTTTSVPGANVPMITTGG